MSISLQLTLYVVMLNENLSSFFRLRNSAICSNYHCQLRGKACKLGIWDLALAKALVSRGGFVRLWQVPHAWAEL